MSRARGASGEGMACRLERPVARPDLHSCLSETEGSSLRRWQHPWQHPWQKLQLCSQVSVMVVKDLSSQASKGPPPMSFSRGAMSMSYIATLPRREMCFLRLVYASMPFFFFLFRDRLPSHKKHTKRCTYALAPSEPPSLALSPSSLTSPPVASAPAPPLPPWCWS